MRIAVTYDNGNVFQHFGKTDAFKVYTVEDGQIIEAEIVTSNGSGHGALAGLLAEKEIDVLICGGIGQGAQAALEDCGIELCAGQEGNTDDVVAAYLAGELVNAGVTCDHHDHEEDHNCGSEGDCGSEGGCASGGCSGCGGGCGGGPVLTVSGPNAGRLVKVHYRGTFNDGTQFDSSYDRDEPMEFQCGVGMMILGFDEAVANMKVGQAVDIHLMPEDAYGMPNPNAIFTVRIEDLPGCETLQAGDHCYLQNAYGQPFMVLVTARDEETITFDGNHEMAGKELNFHIELLEVQ